jgi:hypothetical protein
MMYLEIGILTYLMIQAKRVGDVSVTDDSAAA